DPDEGRQPRDCRKEREAVPRRVPRDDAPENKVWPYPAVQRLQQPPPAFIPLPGKAALQSEQGNRRPGQARGHDLERVQEGLTPGVVPVMMARQQVRGGFTT